MAESTQDTLPTIGPARLSKEIRDALAVPIPAEFIDEVDKGARGVYKVALVDYLETRLTQVDPDWEERVSVSGDVLTCTVVIRGVPRTGVAGIERIAAQPGERGWKDWHMRVGAGAAAAFRRACAKHGLGAELWPKHVEVDDEGEAVAPAATTRPAAQWKSGSGKPQAQTAQPPRRGSKTAPSQKQMELLTGDLQVPQEVASQLDNTDNSRDNPSQASYVISALIAARRADRDAYDDDPMKHIRKALTTHARELVTALGGGSRNRYRDEDEDAD